MKIFCDLVLPAPARKLLEDGTAAHQLIYPEKLADSVLAQAGHDPAFNDVDIAFGQPGAASVMGAERLRWVQVASAGYTRFDTPEFRAAAAARSLILTNSSSVYADPCAEHIFAFMLAQARQLPPALASQCASGTSEWNGLRGNCHSLTGRNALILGYGAIAMRLVQLLQPFGMKIQAYRRRARGNETVPVVSEAELPAALAAADHVIDILPDNADSRHFFGKDRFALLKGGAVFYNIGRGATVDQDALLAALRSGKLSAAWLDVTEPEPLPANHPLLSAPNCHITPHIAGGQSEEAEALVRHFLSNVEKFTAGKPLQDRVM